MNKKGVVKQEFNQVYSIIDIHRKRAFQEINNNSLLIAWNVGGYVSLKIKSEEWGSSVVTELSEYLRTKDPSLKGYSRRTIYKMVQFYDAYSAPEFNMLVDKLNLKGKFNLLSVSGDLSKKTSIVPTLSAQFPQILLCTNWSNHIQILSSCK